MANTVKWIILAILGGALAAFIIRYRGSFGRWYDKVAAFLKEVRVEMEKVVWPSRQEVYGATFVVLVSVLIMTVAFGLEDALLSILLQAILKLA